MTCGTVTATLLPAAVLSDEDCGVQTQTRERTDLSSRASSASVAAWEAPTSRAVVSSQKQLEIEKGQCKGSNIYETHK